MKLWHYQPEVPALVRLYSMNLGDWRNMAGKRKRGLKTPNILHIPCFYLSQETHLKGVWKCERI